MTVLYDVEQYGPILDVKRPKERIIKDEQLATFYLLDPTLTLSISYFLLHEHLALFDVSFVSYKFLFS